jgi:hypothetical protein
METTRLELAKRYLQAVEAGASGDEIVRQHNYDCFEPF